MAEREGKGKSPYQKYNKAPYRYDSVPLNRDGEGVKPTPENIRKFHDKIGLQSVEQRDGSIKYYWGKS